MKSDNISKSLPERSQRLRQDKKSKNQVLFANQSCFIVKLSRINKQRREHFQHFMFFLSSWQIWGRKILPSTSGELCTCNALHSKILRKKKLSNFSFVITLSFWKHTVIGMVPFNVEPETHRKCNTSINT